MSVSDRWLLPDGVDELLPPEAWKVEQMRRAILDIYESYGYELVSPPLIEYLESLLTGTGNALDLQTFKVTDQLTGRLMGVRSDLTPQVARIDSHMLKTESVSRLCYADTVLHTRPAHMLTNRSPIQIGCELFGESSQSADMEIISLMLETLNAAKVGRIHIDLAHVGIYRALVESADFDEKTESQVFDALSRKSIPELDGLAQTDNVNQEIILLIRDVANLSGGVESLNKLRGSVEQQDLSGKSDVLSAICELQTIIDQIQSRFEDVEIGIDFCELRGYNYHTGLLFSAFSMGYGYALAKGGRYDDIGKGFDHKKDENPRPATGFSADLKSILKVSKLDSEQGRKEKVFAPQVSAGSGEDKALVNTIGELRNTYRVVQALNDSDSAESLFCQKQLVKIDGQWRVEPVV
jgi:ATP phosphoribosyltransferase regulatory subunit